LAQNAYVRYDSSTGTWSGVQYASDRFKDVKNCINENMPGQYDKIIQECYGLFTPYKFDLGNFAYELAYDLCLGELAKQINADHSEL
jgi:hypothetical protein